MRDLGRMKYADALAIQRQVNQAVIDGQLPGALLLVEHDPVITVTPRKDAPQHLLATPGRLEQLGIEVVQTDRGGGVTYHGPGQLVAYPIVRLNPLGLNLGRYMRLLERVVIDTAAAFGVAAFRIDGCTGVWAKEEFRVSSCEFRAAAVAEDSKLETRNSKLCAFGVRIRRNTTMHGLALNVTTDLSHFETIVPCGLANRAVTSFAALLGDRAPTMPQVKRELCERFAGALRVSIRDPTIPP